MDCARPSTAHESIPPLGQAAASTSAANARPGLRKAIGAKRRDILTQFLIEASVLSLSGGGIGIALGYAFAKVISAIDVGGQAINAVVTTDIVTLAISVSVIIGLLSGMYPAVRASRLDPISALRYS